MYINVAVHRERVVRNIAIFIGLKYGIIREVKIISLIIIPLCTFDLQNQCFLELLRKRLNDFFFSLIFSFLLFYLYFFFSFSYSSYGG